jgi:hypothetical protein
LLALTISTMIVLLVLLASLVISGFALQWETRTRFAALPADDQALLMWARAQPGVGQLAVRRVGDAVEVRYQRAGSEMLRPLDPPWRDLGYVPVGGMEFTVSASPSGAFSGPLLLLALVLSNQVSFLLVGLLRLRRPKRPGESLAQPFAGALRPAVVGGVVAGALLLVFGMLYDFGPSALRAPSGPGPLGRHPQRGPAHDRRAF